MVHMCKMIISPGVFLHFFKILIFCVVRGVKGQEMVENDKKLIRCARYLRNYLSFMVHMHEMMISPGISFFKILIFQVVSGAKGQKMVQNDKKYCQSCLISQEPYII